MAINFFYTEVETFPLKKLVHKNWFKDVINTYDKQLGDISIIFCSDNYLLEMNKEYLDHDYFTDVITFNYCEENIVSGDIFISIDRVRENATANNVSYLYELERVMVHGVLHLIGFDDVSDILKADMTKAENSALLSLYTVK